MARDGDGDDPRRAPPRPPRKLPHAYEAAHGIPRPGAGWIGPRGPVPGVEALRRRRLLLVVPASILVMTGIVLIVFAHVTTLRERRRERWHAARPALAVDARLVRGRARHRDRRDAGLAEPQRRALGADACPDAARPAPRLARRGFVVVPLVWLLGLLLLAVRAMTRGSG